MIEPTLFNLIKDLTTPAVIGLFLVLIYKAGMLNLVADLFRAKINGNTDLTTNERLDLIANNHLHDVVKALGRIEEKIETMSDNIIYIKAKINGK